MPRTSGRLNHFTESVIRRMTRVANAAGAINLSQGFPDFDPPVELMRAARARAAAGPHQYAITWGAPAFREALARTQAGFMGIPIDPEKHIVVTCGATEAMMASMLTVCDPGDEVIVFSPFYENYGADAILTGAEPVYVELQPPGFTFDEKELRQAFARKPKAPVLCNPSNPSGKVFSRSELCSSPGLRRSPTPSSSPTRSTSTSSTPRSPTPISPRCRACSSGPSLQLPLEDVLHHRLAAGIRDRAPRR